MEQHVVLHSASSTYCSCLRIHIATDDSLVLKDRICRHYNGVNSALGRGTVTTYTMKGNIQLIRRLPCCNQQRLNSIQPEFESVPQAARFRVIQLNNQLFHFLTLEGKMLVGNGGWGYCLNRVPEGMTKSKVLPRPLATANLAKDTATHFTFDGRTPCIELAKNQQLTVLEGCFKLKWRVILHSTPKPWNQ